MNVDTKTLVSVFLTTALMLTVEVVILATLV